MSLELKLLSAVIEPSHEKFTPYLYLDHFGLVTYGANQVLGSITRADTIEKVSAMTLYRKGQLMNQAEKRGMCEGLAAFYHANKSNENALKIYRIDTDPVFFKKHFGVFISFDDVHHKLKEDIKAAIKASRQLFGSLFETFPPKVQLVIALLHYRMKLREFNEILAREINFKPYYNQRKWRDTGILIDKIKAW